MKLPLILFLTLALTACAARPVTPASTQADSTPTPSAIEEAQEVLVSFLSQLHSGAYKAAVPLYGGEYEQLQVFNPETDPNDHVALWRQVCENQQLQCLELRSAAFLRQEDDDYIFQVEFNNADGSLFVLGPCCGADETEMPPVSQFEYTVRRKADGKFVVLNTPPYVP